MWEKYGYSNNCSTMKSGTLGASAAKASARKGGGGGGGGTKAAARFPQGMKRRKGGGSQKKKNRLKFPSHEKNLFWFPLPLFFFSLIFRCFRLQPRSVEEGFFFFALLGTSFLLLSTHTHARAKVVPSLPFSSLSLRLRIRMSGTTAVGRPPFLEVIR